jgi:hypothetical protein
MDFFRAVKKEQVPGESPLESPPAGDETRGELEDLTGRLATLAGLLADAQSQLQCHLARRAAQAAPVRCDGPAATALEEKLDALGRRLDQLLARLGETAATPTPPGTGDETLKNFLQLLRQKLEDIREEQQNTAAALRRLPESIAAGPSPGAERLREPPARPTQQPAAAGPSAPGDWQRAILGRELAEQPGLDAPRQQLLAGILRGEPAACALAGQLLIFQSASTEKMPPLLKDLGEAYYRWQPKAQPRGAVMEEALVRWLQRACESAGISNTIELVNPGERFDSARHNASTRGVEVAEVHGWVVLRDNGKVYTKAAVVVK